MRRRHPVDDQVLVLLASHAPDGGQSFVLSARWAQTCGLPATPRVGRHIRFTRTGRRTTRRTGGVAALHRDPATEHIIAVLARFDTEVERVQRTLPRTRLIEGELLVFDNYRCWHGRDAHTGARTVHVQTVRH